MLSRSAGRLCQAIRKHLGDAAKRRAVRPGEGGKVPALECRGTRAGRRSLLRRPRRQRASPERLRFLQLSQSDRLHPRAPQLRCGDRGPWRHASLAQSSDPRPRRVCHDRLPQRRPAGGWIKPGPFPFNGEFTKLRYVNPWPKPLQKPHPPVWLAGGGSVETWKFAADNDYTYSYLSFSGHKAGKSMMDGYWAEIEKAGLDDNPYRAGFAQLVVVGATDAEAEKLYLKHLRNFYSKALHIPVYMNAVPGFMTKRSAEFALRQGAVRGAHKTILGDPRTASWKDFTESRMVIGGSPDTVAQQLEEAIRNLRIGHLMALFQIQSMDRELTEYSLQLFADKVLPKVRGIWAKEGYEDRWWPQGATRNSRRKAVAAAEAAL